MRSVFLLTLKIFIFFLLGITTFLVFDGLIGVVRSFRANYVPLYERESYLESDDLLGWVSKKKHTQEDSENIFVTTNAQRFRSNKDFAFEQDPLKRRVICSGDSFTFGDGVSNGEDWCTLLEKENQSIESINMGQKGYGFDQIYLWYKRDGKNFSSDIHIVAFITDDFRRMTYSINKPYLKVINGSLRMMNYPVHRNRYIDWVKVNSKIFFTYNLIQSLRTKIELRLISDSATAVPQIPEEQRQRTEAILKDLKKINEQKNTQLVLLHLPSYFDCLGQDGETELWKEYITDLSNQEKMTYIYLNDEFCNRSAKEVYDQFITTKEHDGHFNKEGNAFVAKLVYEKLEETIRKKKTN